MLPEEYPQLKDKKLVSFGKQKDASLLITIDRSEQLLIEKPEEHVAQLKQEITDLQSQIDARQQLIDDISQAR